MSTQQAPSPEGWHLLNSKSIDWPEGTPEIERKGWQYFHESGLKTEVVESPGAAFKAKNELLGKLATEAPGEPETSPEDPIEEVEEQPDGFPNPGAGFSRGLGENPEVKSEVTILGRPDPALFADEPAPAPLTQQMHPSRITTHPSTLMRAGGLDEEHVSDLEAVLRSGNSLPAVDAYFDGTTHWLGDGNHRHAAALRADALLDVVVHTGSLRDAILHAVRANGEHGLKRSNDDKSLAVVTLFADEVWGQQSDTSVAGLADVSQPFVGKVQARLVKLLPLLDGDGVEDPSDISDEEFAERAGFGVPVGLVSAVRSLTDAQLATLTHNVMTRAGSRIAADGKRISVERPPVVETPALFTEEPAQGPPVEAQAPAGEVEEVSAEEEGQPSDETAPEPVSAEAEPEIKVTDRRTFAGEAGRTHETSVQTATGATAQSPNVPPAPTSPALPPAGVVAVPSGEVTLVIKIMSGKASARPLNLSGRIGSAPPSWLSHFTLADLEPMPPALRALLARLGGEQVTPEAAAAPAPSTGQRKAPPKKAAKGGAKKAAGKSSKKGAAKSGAKKKAGKR